VIYLSGSGFESLEAKAFDSSERACPSQVALEFGKDLLDRFRSGEYLGRNTRRAPTARIACRTALPLWEPRLSRITDVAGPERRDKELFDIGEESLAVDGSAEQARRLEAVVAQGGEEGRSFPVAVRNLVDEPLAAGRPTTKARHAGLGPGLVIDTAVISSPPRPMAT
jgi:hypothetical protein